MAKNDINKIIEDHEKRISALEGKKDIKVKPASGAWYKAGSTVDKIVRLVKEGFFKNPKTLSEIISELKTRDHHLEPSDLTLPMRRIVHKGLLKKTKTISSGVKSKKWMYIEIWGK